MDEGEPGGPDSTESSDDRKAPEVKREQFQENIANMAKELRERLNRGEISEEVAAKSMEELSKAAKSASRYPSQQEEE